MAEFSVWLEGYEVTGNESNARFVGTVEADTFAEACAELMAKPPWNDGNFNREALTYWGCRLFDNEADARKTFTWSSTRVRQRGRAFGSPLFRERSHEAGKAGTARRVKAAQSQSIGRHRTMQQVKHPAKPDHRSIPALRGQRNQDDAAEAIAVACSHPWSGGRFAPRWASIRWSGDHQRRFSPRWRKPILHAFPVSLAVAIAEYGFVEGQDYVIVQDLRSPVSGSSKSRGQIAIDYHGTLDMGKELAMVENNEIGRNLGNSEVEKISF
jgi:hypothetical protein